VTGKRRGSRTPKARVPGGMRDNDVVIDFVCDLHRDQALLRICRSTNPGQDQGMMRKHLDGELIWWWAPSAGGAETNVYAWCRKAPLCQNHIYRNIAGLEREPDAVYQLTLAERGPASRKVVSRYVTKPATSTRIIRSGAVPAVDGFLS
jgi:hypothetical protein